MWFGRSKFQVGSLLFEFVSACRAFWSGIEGELAAALALGQARDDRGHGLYYIDLIGSDDVMILFSPQYV